MVSSGGDDFIFAVLQHIALLNMHAVNLSGLKIELRQKRHAADERKNRQQKTQADETADTSRHEGIPALRNAVNSPR